MNSNLEKLAKAIGLNPSLLNDIEDESFDIEKVAGEFNKVKKSLIEKELKEEFKDQLKTEYGKTMIKVMGDLNKKFNLDYTNDEIKNTSYDEFLEKAHEVLQDNNSDSKSKYKEKYDEVANKLANVKQEYSTTIENIKNEYENKLSEEQSKTYKYINDSEFESAWSQLNIADIPKEHINFIKNGIKNEVFSNYKVNDNKEITDLEGNPAINFAKNGQYNSLLEPIKHLADQNKILKVSGGGNDREDKRFRKEDDESSNQATSLRERARAQGAQV